jgi:AcrR family transcriptional regulator
VPHELLLRPEGEPAYTGVQRIATEVGAAPMSLYRHVNGKDELLASMMDSVFGEDPLPARPPEGWRAQLELSSRMEWQGFRRHPWLAAALSITRPQLIPSAMRHTEWALRALDGLGLTIQEMLYIHTTLFSHVRGLAFNLEGEAQAEQDSGLTSDEWMQTQEHGFRAIAVTGGFPLLNRLVNSEIEMDLDQLFEFGLARLLDGLERHLADRHESPDACLAARSVTRPRAGPARPAVAGPANR